MAKRPTRALAILAMVTGMAFIPAADASGKVMFERYGVDPIFVAWARCVTGAVILLALRGRRAIDRAAFQNPGILFRGFLFALTLSAILSAVETIPLATAFAAFFVAPVVSYALSVAVLGEVVSLVRTALLLIGFGGVLLVVQPGADLPFGVALAALAGVFYGSFLTTSRAFASQASGLAMLMVQLVVGSFLLAPFGLTDLPQHWSGTLLFLLLLSAGFSMLGNLLILQAYQMAEATRLAPFVYFQLIAATLIGFAIFGDWPNAVAQLGLAVLVVSGFGTMALRPGGERGRAR